MGRGAGASAEEEREFQLLYRKTYGFVRQRARQLLHDDEGALDAAQEAFTRAWERWRKVAAAPSRTGWLIVTVTRICLDRLRRNRWVAPMPQELEEPPPARDDHLVHLLRLRLAREKVVRQQIVIHTWLDGMTQEETAALLGISRKTVQRQLEAFREKHARELAELAEVPDGL